MVLKLQKVPKISIYKFIEIECCIKTFVHISLWSNWSVCGVIDQNHRGIIYVLVYNTSIKNSFKIKKGDRIAQIVLMPMISLKLNTIPRTPIKK